MSLDNRLLAIGEDRTRRKVQQGKRSETNQYLISKEDYLQQALVKRRQITMHNLRKLSTKSLSSEDVNRWEKRHTSMKNKW